MTLHFFCAALALGFLLGVIAMDRAVSREQRRHTAAIRRIVR